MFSMDFDGGRDTIEELHQVEVRLEAVTKAIKEAKKTGSPYKELRIDQQDLRVEAKKLNDTLREGTNNWAKQTRETKAASDSVVGLNASYAKLYAQYTLLSKEARDSKMGKAMAAEAARVKDEILKADSAVRSFKSNIGNYKSAGAGFLDGISGGLSTQGFGGVGLLLGAAALTAGKEVVQLNTEIDKQQGAIAKTTGLNAAAVERLTSKLKDLDTITPTKDLLKIAEEAGRFGVEGEKGVQKFTEAINLLAQGLGDEFKGGVEEITTTVAQLSNVIYGASTNGEVMADRYQRIGNVLNGLANSGSATAGQIAEVATRMGGVSKALGFTEAEILGISSGIVEAGINVERGSTAFTRVNGIIRQNTEQVSKFLGITKEAFEDLLDTKPVEAFQKVVARVAEVSGGSGTKIAQILKDLHINSQAAQELFLKWGQQQELFNDRIVDSNQLITSTNTLLRDQATLTDTVSGQWSRFGNALSDLFENAGLQTGIKNLGRTLADFTNQMANGEFKKASMNLMELINYVSGINAIKGVGTGLVNAYKKYHTDFMERTRTTGREGVLDFNQWNGNANGVEVRNNPLDRQQYGNANPLFDTKRVNQAQLDNLLNTDYEGGFEKGGKTAEIAIVAGSLRDLEAQLARVNTILNNTNPDSPYFKGLIEQATTLTEKVKDAKMYLDNSKKGVVGASEFATVDVNGNLPQFVKDAEKEALKAAEDSIKEKEKLAKKAIEQNKKDKEEEEEWMAKFRERQSKREAKWEEDELKRKEDEKEKKQKEREEIFDATMSSVQNVSDAVFAYQESERQRHLAAELDAVDREYKAKYDAAAGNATLQEAILKQQEEKRQKLQKEAFEKDKKAKIQQALINGALGVTNAIATAPDIVAGLILAAGVAITTGIEVANIKRAKFAKGGHTGKSNGGYKDETGLEVAGVVHKDEYVVNPRQVQEFRPVIDMFEKDRVSRLRGFADGGFTSIPQLSRFSGSSNNVQFSDTQVAAQAEILAARMVPAIYKAVLEGSTEGAKQGTYYGATEGNRTKQREDQLLKTTEY